LLLRKRVEGCWQDAKLRSSGIDLKCEPRMDEECGTGVATWVRLYGNTEWDSEYTVRLELEAEPEFPELLGV
jgi:hypothetical protein